MSGGGSQTSTTVNQADPRIWNAVERNVNRATGIADQPFQSYGGQFTADLTGNQNQAIGMAPGLFNAGSGAVNTAVNAAGGLLNTQNPWTEQVVNRTLGDLNQQRERAIAGNTDAAIGSRAFGNNSRIGVADALTNEAFAKQSADTSAALRSGGFDRSLQATAQGAGLLGQLGGQQQQMYNTGLQGLLQTGGLQQGTQQSNLDALYQEYLRGQEDPFRRQQLINASLGLLPQGGTASSTQPIDRTGQALGLLGTAAMAFSDERVKADIETVGYDAKGRRWATWRYNWEGPRVRHFGLIAQESLKTDPEAVIMGQDGFYRIDYSKLTRH